MSASNNIVGIPTVSIQHTTHHNNSKMQSPSHTQRLLSILLSLMDILNQNKKILTEEPVQTDIDSPVSENSSSRGSSRSKSLRSKPRSLTNDFQDMSKLLRVIELRSQLGKDISRISALNDTDSELDPKEIENMYRLLRNILRDVSDDADSEAFVHLYSQGKKLASEAALSAKPPLSPSIIDSSASYDSYSCSSGSETESHKKTSSGGFGAKTLYRCSSSINPQVNKSPKALPSRLNANQLNSPSMKLLTDPRLKGTERMRLSNSLSTNSSPTLNREYSVARLSDEFEELDLMDNSSLSNNPNTFDNRASKGQFALSVLVGDPYRVGQGYRSFTVYSCQARSTDGKIYSTKKRYSDFGRLRDNLVRLYPQFKKHIPRMPQKKVVGKFEVNFVEKRRQGLEYFLTYVALHPVIGCSPQIVRFFT